jgi:hypothetical protein
MRHIDIKAVGVLLLLMTGCEHADPLDEGGQDATFSSIQAGVFNTNCAVSGCHDGSGSNLPGSLDLRDGQAYANLVGVTSLERPALARVEPSDPDDSYLVRKIEGGPDISGSRMPLGRPALAQVQIDLIREWIAEGAEEN